MLPRPSLSCVTFKGHIFQNTVRCVVPVDAQWLRIRMQWQLEHFIPYTFSSTYCLSCFPSWVYRSINDLFAYFFKGHNEKYWDTSNCVYTLSILFLSLFPVYWRIFQSISLHSGPLLSVCSNAPVGLSSLP